MNSILLSGYMGKDPEIRVTRDGKSIANFSLGVNRRFAKERTTDWFNCTAFSKTADFIGRYLRKGSKIIVEGEIQNDNYEKDGRMVYGYKVIVNQVEFADSKQSKEETKEEADPQWMQVDEEEIPFK